MGNSCFSGLNRVASVSKRSKSSCRSSSSNHRESGAYPNISPGILGNKLTCSRTSKSQGNKMRFPDDSFSTPQEELMDLHQNSGSNHLRRSKTIPPLISQTNVTLSPLGVEGESGERQEPMLSIPPGPHAVLQRGNGILREQGRKEESRNLATRIEDSQLATDGIGKSTAQMQSGTNRPLKLTDSNGFVNQSETPTLAANQGTPLVQTESTGLIQRSQSNFISMTPNSLYIQALSQAYNGPPSHLHNGGLDNASTGSGGQRGLKIRAWIDDILRATKPGPSGLHGTAAQPRPKEADSQRVVASTKIPVSGVWDAEVERNKGDNYNATKEYSNQYSPPREEWTLDRYDSDAEITSPAIKLTESALRELDKTTTQPLSAHDVYGRIAMWMLNIVPCTLPTEVSVTDAAPLFQPPSNLGVGVQRPSTQVAPVTLPSAPATHQMQLQNSAYDDLKSKEVSNEKPMNVFSENSEPNFQEVLHT